MPDVKGVTYAYSDEDLKEKIASFRDAPDVVEIEVFTLASRETRTSAWETSIPQ